MRATFRNDPPLAGILIQPMDQDTFIRLVERTEGPLRSYLAGIGVPAADVDDLAQEAYLAHFRQDGRMPAEAEELGWLKGIARNLALRFFRTRARHGRPTVEVVDLLEAAAVGWGQASEDAQLDALRRCLEGLDERARSMVQAYYAGGSSAEVGTRFSISPEAVRVLMLRLRDRLRTCIQRRLVADGGI